MLIDEIRAGESSNIEFKVEVPKKSEKYIKTVVAFANTAGGKIIIGIAEIFSRMKIIESWGTGIKRMYSSCKEYGIREPELLEIGDSFRVNLYRPSYKNYSKSSSKSSLKSSSKNSSKSSSKNLNTTQNKILEMIQKNPKVTQEKMSEKLTISKRAIQKNIKEMVDRGIVKREGSARNGYWKIL